MAWNLEVLSISGIEGDPSEDQVVEFVYRGPVNGLYLLGKEAMIEWEGFRSRMTIRKVHARDVSKVLYEKPPGFITPFVLTPHRVASEYVMTGVILADVGQQHGWVLPELSNGWNTQPNWQEIRGYYRTSISGSPEGTARESQREIVNRRI